MNTDVRGDFEDLPSSKNLNKFSEDQNHSANRHVLDSRDIFRFKIGRTGSLEAERGLLV